MCLQRVIGTELSFKSLGFATVMDFISAMPDVVAWERPSSGDWLLHDASAPRPLSPPPSGMSVLCSTLFPVSEVLFLSTILEICWEEHL